MSGAWVLISTVACSPVMRGIETSSTQMSGCSRSAICDGLDAVAGLGDDLHVGLAVEQQPQPAAHDAVVVGDQEPHHAGATRPAGADGELDGRALAGRRRDLQAPARQQRALAHARQARAPVAQAVGIESRRRRR